MRENLKKISIVIKNVNGSYDTRMHKAERPSNCFSKSFTHYQAEQVKLSNLCPYF